MADGPAAQAPTAADRDPPRTLPRPGVGEPAAAARAPRWNLQWELLAFLELLGACGLAVAQPLLDVTGRSPDFFLFNSADTSDFIVLLAMATLLLPLALWALGAATGVAGGKAREVAHLLLVAAVLVVLAIVVGKHLTALRGLRLTAVALLVGAILSGVYARTEFLRKMLQLLSAAPVLFVALFVLVSPSGTILMDKEVRPSRPVAAGASAVKHPPVVMIVFDEFPLISLMDAHGEIDARRYPNFARLAQQSTWFRNATAVSAYTPQAVPAMLTGRYPAKVAAPFYAEYPDNIFTLLGGTYELKVQESVTLLCPPRTCPTGPQAEPAGGSTRAVLDGLATLLRSIVSPYDSTADPTAGFREPTVEERAAGADRTTRRTSVPRDFRFDAINQNQPASFTTFVNGLRPSPTPQLHFLHVLLPHVPYRHLASGTQYDIPDIRLGGDAGARRPWWLRLLRERYDAQLSYTDRLIGQAMRQLRRSGLFDKALVVVTADHGVSFAPDKYKRDYLGSEADVLWVPLFVKAPGQKTGRVDDRNWEHVDLLPTIAHYAGVEIPWRIDGIDALRQRRDRDDKWFHPSVGKRVTVQGPVNFANVLRGWPPVAHILPELTGRRVADLQVRGSGPVAQVRHLDRFENLPADATTIPAFVYGLLPSDLPVDTRVAIAVNGRIGTVAAAAHRDPEHLWFAGLITNHRLFVPGRNKLELFLVDQGGRQLRQLAITDLDR